ncbi:hypothetical protein K9L16_01900 [Candidatus Pacearchaeota archaeon]|nr:hypothetical protein [Candidatus Pacearchaeota archaeon]
MTSEKPEINFEDFMKLDLRVGKIIEVEDVEGADKLYKLKVDVGPEIPDSPRTLLAGLKPFYKKEDLKDKLIIVIVNLQPRRMRGIESQGMLLAASTEPGDSERQVFFLTPNQGSKKGDFVEFKK